jgi:hypothetical protein
LYESAVTLQALNRVKEALEKANTLLESKVRILNRHNMYAPDGKLKAVDPLYLQQLDVWHEKARDFIDKAALKRTVTVEEPLTILPAGSVDGCIQAVDCPVGMCSWKSVGDLEDSTKTLCLELHVIPRLKWVLGIYVHIYESINAM